jgi:galactoside O-acetyltransferase
LNFFFTMLAFCLRKPSWVLGEICDRVYSYWCSVQFKACGEKFKIKTASVIFSPENITIGNNFRSMGNLYMYGNEGEILIGDSASLNTNVMIGASGGRIVIGNNVLIAANVVIRSADHGTRASVPIRDQPHTPGVINIEDDVWIGSNAVITSNVTLSRGTIVGAGAVVTKSTEPYSIVGGVPAQKISQRM